MEFRSPKTRAHTVEVVVDLILIRTGIRRRIEMSVKAAMDLAEGLVTISAIDIEERLFSERQACINCGVNIPTTLAVDGIYVVEEGGQVAFRPVPPPSDAEVARLTERVQGRIGKLLERRGLGPQADHDESDPLVRNEPLLAELYSASISGRVATGPRAGRRLAKVGDEVDVENLAVSAGLRCATISGFSVHANVCVPAHDRVRLERLARYETGDATLFPAEATHNSDIAPREIE